MHESAIRGLSKEIKDFVYKKRGNGVETRAHVLFSILKSYY